MFKIKVCCIYESVNIQIGFLNNKKNKILYILIKPLLIVYFDYP